MHGRIERALRDLARRAGIGDVPAPVVAAVLVLGVMAVAWAAWRWWPRGEADIAVGGAGGGAVHAAAADAHESSTDTRSSTSLASSDTTAPTQSGLFVHVAGHVRRPGVYELPVGSRVIDAVDAAGGALGDAMLDALNLARALTDGEQVIVSSRAELEKSGGSAALGSAAALPNAPGNPAGKVNLNTADVSALDTLPGVGPSTAQKIVAEREANGPFASVEDLGRVSGIGPKRLEQLKDLVCVR